MATIALVGNPNCGKTTLYNALTGSHQQVGNWPGVTVERRSGSFIHQQILFEVVDLPGVYSLTTASHSAGVDENIACRFILDQQADFIVNIIDASNLERHLYLTLQLLEMQVPLIVAVNMTDVAASRGLELHLDRLAKILGCPVIPLQANQGKGINALKNALMSGLGQEKSPAVFLSAMAIPYAVSLQTAIAELSRAISHLKNTHTVNKEKLALHIANSSSDWLATRLLEGDVVVQEQLPQLLPQVADYQQKIRELEGEDTDILLADGRYRFIHQLMTQCCWQSQKSSLNWTSRLDRIILNRIIAIPLFLTVMYFLFFFAINIGGAFQDFFDQTSALLFVDGFSHWLQRQGVADTWVILLAQGIGRGLNTTMTFIPVIGALFLFLAFLEDSGYMARAAFVVDRLMRFLGLPGKAFVPMIVGFGCNVPAIMAARILENKRDRILTIMMSPFMSCGARLAIYAVFTAAFFPHNGHRIVFMLYLIGIIMALFSGFLLRKTLLAGQPAPLIMELPPYHLPQLSTLLVHAGLRLKAFIVRAGKLIIPVCMLMAVLQAFSIKGHVQYGQADFQSLLAVIGRWLTPIFTPMGIQADNWPATVGLLGGILAKEVVVGTLNALYSQLGHFNLVLTNGFDFWHGLHAALITIPENFSKLGQAMLSPLFSAAPVPRVNHQIYGVMYQYFGGPIAAFSYLLFVLLYFPCVSTTAAMLRELDYRWAIFSIVWMTSVAYGAAVIFYQSATLMQHVYSSLAWIGGLLLFFGLVVMSLRFVVAAPDSRLSFNKRNTPGVQAL